MTEVDLDDFQNDSTFIWAVNNVNLPKGDPWDFSDRQWQLALMDDNSKEIVVRKPTQVGLSTVMLVKMMHFTDLVQCRATMTLPRQDDVYDLVNSRLSEIIANSPYIKSRMGAIDNVRMKQFGKSWIHFVEMSVPPRMMDVDWMLNDEVDLSNSDHLEQAISRMDASKYGYHHRISTPSINGYGIDALYALSDKKVWIVKCAYCSHEQDLNWDLNVANKGSKTWYKCARCGNVLHPQDIREGRWQATGDPKSPLSGYQINQMMCTYIDPNKMWIQHQTMSRKNFYNFRLGLPYTATSGGFDRDAVSDRCFASGHDKEGFAKNQDATYVLGADQGDAIHVSVGRLEDDGVKIVHLEEIPFDLGFDRLGKLMRDFGVKIAVIDGLPNHHSAKRLVKDFQGVGYVAYFSSVDKIFISKEDEQKVSINKTDAYDHLLHMIANSELQFYGLPAPLDEATNLAVSHICNMRRDIEEQYTRAGGVKTFHVWKGVGPDHYADSLLYMSIAADIAASSNKSLSMFDISEVLRNKDGLGDYAWNELMVDPTELDSGEDASLTKLNDGESIPIEELDLVPDNPYASNDAILKQLFG